MRPSGPGRCDGHHKSDDHLHQPTLGHNIVLSHYGTPFKGCKTASWRENAGLHAQKLLARNTQRWMESGHHDHRMPPYTLSAWKLNKDRLLVCRTFSHWSTSSCVEPLALGNGCASSSEN